MDQYILVMSLALQLVAAALAIALIRITGTIWAWVLVAAALVMMTGRRAITLAAVLSDRADVNVSAELVALAISVAMVIGVALIRPVFTRMRDLTRDLSDRERELRALIDAAPDGIALCRDGECLYVNGALARLLGEAPDGEAARDSLFSRVHPDDREAFLEPMRSAAPAEPTTPALTRAVRFRGPGGAVVPVEIVYGPEVSRGGRKARLLQLRNLSERKRLEAQLVEATKLEAIGRLSGGIAHDFNNLLTVVVSSIDLARMKQRRGADPSPEIDAIDQAASRAARLTSQLLTYARSQPVSPSGFDLNQLVRDTSAMLRRVLREDVHMELALNPDPVPVFADRGHVEQVLMNLAINACDAMTSGGHLVLTTAVADTPILGPADAAGSGAPAGELTVRDDGCGIAPELQARVFEPFFTTKEVGAGTGLGLSSAHGIVSRMGGRIELESTPGRGSTFRVLLPGARELREPASHPPSDAMSHGHERVLLVEDESELARLAADALRARGYDVVEVQSGERALSLLRDGASSPDILVTDVVMPDIGGRELAREARSRLPGLPVLFMTGYGEQVLDPEEASDDLAVLHKPFTPNMLAARIREVLDRHEAAGSTSQATATG
jgi:PAS domain S-box-containing protein